jgi:hypothetical protein
MAFLQLSFLIVKVQRFRVQGYVAEKSSNLSTLYGGSFRVEDSTTRIDVIPNL